MNNSKLVNILRTLSKHEFKEFEKFISSPYFNKGRNYLPFFSVLKKFYPKFDDKKLTQEYIYSKLYPGKKYNKQIIWNMTSALLDMTEEFLILHSLRENIIVGNQALAEEYYHRNLSSYFLKTIDKMEDKLNRDGIDDNYFASKTQTERLRKAYNFLEDTQHLVQQHIVRRGEYTILGFLRTMSGVINDITANLLMFNAMPEINISYNFINNLNINEIVEYAKEKNYKYAWFIEICCYSILLFMEKNSEKYFMELKKLVKENFSKLTRAEKNSWLTVLANYCSNKTGDEEMRFRKELFEINKLSMKEDVWIDERYLYKIKFIQVLRNAVSVNENQWAKSFIEKYVPRLKPSYQKSMRALGYAFLNFNLKNYEAVLENLKDVKFIDTRDKLHVRSLYLRTYYEMNAIETVISQIDATKHFLNKNLSVTNKTRKSYLVSLNLLNRLINLKINNSTNGLEDMLKEIDENRDLILGTWLKEKIEDLKTKR